jgi:hypothetical protein
MHGWGVTMLAQWVPSFYILMGVMCRYTEVARNKLSVLAVSPTHG